MKDFKNTETLTYHWYRGNIDEDRKNIHMRENQKVKAKYI